MRSKTTPFPWGAATFAAVGLVAAVVGLAVPESVDWVIEHVEIGTFGRASASTSTSASSTTATATAAAAAERGTASGTGGAAGGARAEKAPGEENTSSPGEKDPAKVAANKVGTKGETVPDTRGWSQEELSFFNKLGERKRELDLREADLAKLEEELQKQKLELDEKIKQLETMRSQITRTLKSRVETDREKVVKLIDVYSGMKPQQAAKVIETINEDLAVEVLDGMKKKAAADILNVMEASKARRLSELLAGYKKTAN